MRLRFHFPSLHPSIHPSSYSLPFFRGEEGKICKEKRRNVGRRFLFAIDKGIRKEGGKKEREKYTRREAYKRGRAIEAGRDINSRRRWGTFASGNTGVDSHVLSTPCRQSWRLSWTFFGVILISAGLGGCHVYGKERVEHAHRERGREQTWVQPLRCNTHRSSSTCTLANVCAPVIVYVSARKVRRQLHPR